MKKIAPNYFISNKLPSTIKKYLDKRDNINRVTILTTLLSYTQHIPHIELFSENNRTLKTGVDDTCFGSWSVKDAQSFILSIYTEGKISTPIVLCDNGANTKKDIVDAGNRTRTLRNWEDDQFPLPKKATLKFKNKTYDIGGMTYSEVSVKYKQLHTTRYEKATVTVEIEYGLSRKKKAQRFLHNNKQKPVKNHEKLFVEPTELISRLRNLAHHMPLFETTLLNGKRVPSYINLTDKNLEAPKTMLKLYAYMQAKYIDERDVKDIKIPKTKIAHLAQTCNLSKEDERAAWQKMCETVKQIQSLYDAAPMTKYDPSLSESSQSSSTSSRYFNFLFVVLDNFDYLFGADAVIKNKKLFQSTMNRVFMKLDTTVQKGNDESPFRRHTRKLFDPLPKDSKMHTRLKEVLDTLLEEILHLSPDEFGIVYKDPTRCFSRAMIDYQFAKQGDTCGVTHEPIHRSDAVGAHIIPHSRGGRTTYDNLIVVSKHINDEMGAMTLDEYLETKRSYSIQ